MSEQTPTAAELQRLRERVAIQHPEHLKRWLAATSRETVIFVTADLVDALVPIQDQGENVGLAMLQNLINAYRAHRRTLPTGDTQTEKLQSSDGTRRDIEVPVYKDDRLTIAERDGVIRALIRDQLDEYPEWVL